MAALDQKSPNVLLQSLCCRITGKSEAEVAHQFQYAVRVVGSNYAPTIERDEFLVSEKIKKELLKQRRESDAARSLSSTESSRLSFTWNAFQQFGSSHIC
ncbi:gamma-tubulin complex component 3-like [Salvelinus sp. IW2-2015]|uniref:gamma-tubulin complex component 3-like n=1 Tax=Salvelinus sp. IW2-2015 TaxID=2691554 RepID=UPI0038D41BBC